VKPEPVHRLKRALAALTPALVTLALVFAAQLPYGIPHFAPVTPALALMAIYYWSIYRPEKLPLPAVFAIGLVQDALSGGPMGMIALMLVAVYGIGVSQRRFFLGKSFLVEWLGFVVIAAGAAIAAWLIASLYYATILDPRTFAAQGLLTAVFYPCMSWLFVRAQRRFMRYA
jgi:rod shape-determining protein MreD